MGTADLVIDADVSVLLVGTDGKVSSNEAFVFYNQPIALEGAVHLREKLRIDEDPDHPTVCDVVTLELDDVPDSVDRIVLSASLDAAAGHTFGSAHTLALRIFRTSDAQELVHYGITGLVDETAVLFGEFYRRGGEWKLRAIGQGYEDGLERLITDFGVEVDADEPAEADEAERPADLSPAPEASSAESTGETAAPPAPPSERTPPDETEPGDDRTAAKQRVSVRRPTRAPRLPADWNSTIPADGDSDWQPARLFPVAGIGGAEEQERRATSALLAVARTVREFGRSLASRAGAPGGTVQTFIEVPFAMDDQTYRPDGVIVVTRGRREWRALVEVKTADAALNATQVETYVDVARAKGFDAVITISNQLSGQGEHPVPVDRRKLKKVSLHHLAWDEIRTEAILLARHRQVADSTQHAVLAEFLRYMEHPRSGLHGFTDMGPRWVQVRDAVKNKTVRPADKGCAEVILQFDQLVRRVALRLSGLLGVDTSVVVPRSRPDATTRQQQLADSGQLFGSIKVPGAVDGLVVTADLRSEHVTCSIQCDAPRDGRPLTRINWLLRQIPDARPSLRIEALLAGSRASSTAGLLSTIREKPETLIPADGRDIRGFRVSLDVPMGSKRGAGRGGLIHSVETATVHLYAEVVQHLRPWSSKPPRLPAGSTT